MFRKYKTGIERWLWEQDADHKPLPVKWLLLTLRLFYVLIQNLSDVQFTMRATGMVYISILSLVPLIALSFSVLKALGIHNQIEPALLTMLQPLGENAAQLTSRIIGFVENVKVGVLGALGVALLIYTVMSLIQKVENGFNYVWRINRARSLGQRFSEYLSVLLVGPLLISSALAMMSGVMEHAWIQALLEYRPLGLLAEWVTSLVPFMLLTLGFTFLYMFIPNTRVQLLPALSGGLFASLMWSLASMLFGMFAGNSTKYDAIYSGFAIVIFLLIWLYVCWLIMLLGCNVAFLVQHPVYLRQGANRSYAGSRLMEQIMLLIMTRIAERFVRGEPAVTETELTREIQAPPDQIYGMIDKLLEHGFLAETADQKTALLPGMDLQHMRIADLLQLLQGETSIIRTNAEHDNPITDILQLLDDSRQQALATTTVADLVRQRE